MDTQTQIQALTVALLVVGAAVAAPIAVTGADEPTDDLPAAYYGSVTIDGEPAPAGTTVQAVVNGTVRAEITVEESGEYGGPGGTDEKLVVEDAADIENGSEVTFFVEGDGFRTQVARKNPDPVSWSPGDVQQVNLEATVDELLSTPLNLTANRTDLDAGEPVEFTLRAEGDLAEPVDGNVTFAGETKRTGTDGTVVFRPTESGDLQAVGSKGDTEDRTFTDDSVVVTVNPPTLTVQNTSLDFGSVPLNETANGTVTVKNNGSVDIGLGGTDISGNDSGRFTVVGDPTGTIGPGNTTNVTVEYDPADRGDDTAELQVFSDITGQNPDPVSLSGTGVAPGLAIEGLPVEIADDGTDFAATSSTITLNNTGNADLNASLSINDTDHFGISTSSISSLGASSTKTIEITFDAMGVDDDELQTTLVIDPESPTLDPVEVPVVGIVEIASVDISPDRGIDYGNVTSGESDSAAVTVVNDGTVPLTVDPSTTNSSDSDGGDFALGNSDRFTLDPGQDRRLTVTATADTRQTGSFSGVVNVTTNESSVSDQVDLNATRVAPELNVTRPAEADEPLDLGDSPVNSSTTGTVTVANDGTADLTVNLSEAFNDSEAAAGFEVVSNEQLVIEPGGERNVTVGFTPTAPGENTSTLTLATNDGSAGDEELMVDLNASGVEANISVSPSTARFGTVGVGNATELDVEVTNQGDGTLDLSTSLAGGSDFEVVAVEDTSVEAGSSTNVTVSFAPSEEGERTGTLLINGTVGAETSTAGVALTGEGEFPTLSLDSRVLRTGVAEVGDTTSNSLLIANDGPAGTTIAIDSVSVDSDNFSVTGAPGAVDAGERAPIEVAFTAPADGEQRATVTLNATLSPARGGPTISRTVTVTGEGSGPVVVTSTDAVDVGTVDAGTAVQRTVILENDGGSGYTISGVEASGSDAVSATRIGPERVVPGGETAVEISVAPAAAGALDADVTVTTAEGTAADPTIAVTGNAVEAETNVSDQAIDFGEVANGSGVQRAVEIRNDGNATLRLAAIDVAGDDADQFAVLGGPDQIRPGRSDTVLVGFAPSQTGVADGTLVIEPESDPDTDQVTVQLTGESIEADASLTPSTVRFGKVPLDETQNRTLVLRNDGDDTLNVTDVRLFGGTDTQFFGIEQAPSGELAPGETRNVTVNVTARDRATLSAGVLVNAEVQGDVTSSETSVTSSLGATGAAADADFRSRSLDAGAVRLGERQTASITVDNDGNAALNLTNLTVTGSDARSFAVVDDETDDVIASGNSGEIVVEFSPGSAPRAVSRATDGTPLTAAATLELNTSAPEDASVTVDLTGEGRTTSLTPATKALQFGTTPVGEDTTRQIRIRNELGATAPVNVTGVTLSGRDSDEYDVEGLASSVRLDPGESVSVNVTLSPVDRQPPRKFATLSIAADDPRQPAQKVGLSNDDTVYQVTFGSANVSYINPDADESDPEANIDQGLQGQNASLRTIEPAGNTSRDYSVNLTTASSPGDFGATFDEGETAVRAINASATTELDDTTNTTLGVTVSKAALVNSTGNRSRVAPPENVTFYRAPDDDLDNFTAVQGELLFETEKGYVYAIDTPGFSVFSVAIDLPTVPPGLGTGPDDGTDEPDDGTDEPDETDDIGDDDDAGGGGGGGSIGPSPVRQSRALDQNGVVELDVSGGTSGVERVRVASPGASGEVTVEELTELPEGTPEPTQGERISTIDISAPDPTDGSATVRITISRTTVDAFNAQPENLRVVHFVDGEWRQLDTTLVSEDPVVVKANVEQFSPFAVIQLSDQGAATSTATPAPESDTETATTAPEPDTATPEPEDTTTATPTETATELPGFGPIVAIIAVVALGLVVLRRRN